MRITHNIFILRTIIDNCLGTNSSEVYLPPVDFKQSYSQSTDGDYKVKTWHKKDVYQLD